MRNKHYKKEHKGYLVKIITAISVVAVVTVCSIVGVMANTVPCTVFDSEKSYSFNLLTPDTDGIIAKAIEEGMAPLSEKDKVVRDEKNGRVDVYRALDISVENDGAFTAAYGYKNDTVRDVLKNNNIEYNESDVIVPTLDTVITKETSIKISAESTVCITADGKTKAVVLKGGTVSDALKALEITLNKGDKVSRDLTAKVFDGMTVNVTRVKNITLNIDGKEEKKSVYSSNVRLLLKELGVTLDKEDTVSPALTEKITDGMTVDVTRVEYKEVTETETVDYETVYEDTDELNEGETQVKTAGAEGEREVVYREIYKDGELSEKKEISQKITKDPVNEVVLRGTYVSESSSEDTPVTNTPDYTAPTENNGGNTFTDYNGNEVSYSNVLYGSGTAYCIPGGTTSIGLPVSVGIVAVDPDIIPYGTKLYIVADGLVYGYAVAGDTGGALMSGEALVDVYYDTLEECYNFGRRDCTVYILG